MRPTRSARPGEPIRSYLDIPAIVGLAKEKQVDAIHPGYGFLSENADSREPARAGIVFVGPRAGATGSAGRQGGGTEPGTRGRRADPCRQRLAGAARPRGARVAEALGYPVIVKAAMGGGGRRHAGRGRC